MADQAAPGERPAGWKKDPTGRHFGRYWDGQGWTEHVISAQKVQGVDPMPADPEPSLFAGAPPGAPRGRPTAPTPGDPVASSSAKRPKDGGVKVTNKSGTKTLMFPLQEGKPGDLWIDVAYRRGEVVRSQKDLQTSGPSDSTSATAPQAKTVYKVGDTAKTGAFEVTVFGYRDPHPSANQFDKPAPGSRYVSVDVQVANPGSRQEVFSSIVGLHVVDTANRQYDIAITTGTPRAPDGQVPAGQAVRGIAVFEVPDGTTGLRLRVQGGLTASGAFFTLA